MMLLLRRVIGAVILIGVFIFSTAAYSSPLHPPPGWLMQALLNSTSLLLLTAAAGWLMMRPGGGVFARPVRMCGMALVANPQLYGSSLSLTPAYYGLFGNPVGSMMQQVLLESCTMFAMVIQPLVGLLLWLCGGLVDDDPERQWQGWRRLVRLAGIVLVVGAGVGLLVAGTAVLHPGRPPVSLQVLGKNVFGACVMGGIGAYLIGTTRESRALLTCRGR